MDKEEEPDTSTLPEEKDEKEQDEREPEEETRESPSVTYKVVIPNTETRTEPKKHTVFHIIVTTREEETLETYHRYSKFLSLHQHLASRYPLIVVNKLKFPEKKLFKLDPKIVESRRMKLEQYMNDVAANANLVLCPEVVDFLQLPRSLLGFKEGEEEEEEEGEEQLVSILGMQGDGEEIHAFQRVERRKRWLENESEVEKIVRERLEIQTEEEICDIIRHLRIGRMTGEGTTFSRLRVEKKKDKTPFTWNLCVDPTGHVLSYKRSNKEHDNSVPINVLLDIEEGNDVPMLAATAAKKRPSDDICERALSIGVPEETGLIPPRLELVASSVKVRKEWADGLRFLMGREMVHSVSLGEKEDVRDVVIQLRMLNLPDMKKSAGECPPVPKPPANYNFKVLL